MNAMRWRFTIASLRSMAGRIGLRNKAPLKSGLARPQQHYAYAGSPDIINLAAAYTSGIVRNNKRTGFVVGILFLEINGYRFTASEESPALAVLDLAAGKLDEAGYTDFLRANASRAKK